MEQTKQLQDSFMPEKFRVLSGSALKVLAMVIMLIDHTAAFLLVKIRLCRIPGLFVFHYEGEYLQTGFSGRKIDDDLTGSAPNVQ